MSDISNQEVPFWPHEKQVNFDGAIPLLYKVEKNYLDKEWPENGGAQSSVIRQLKGASRAWVSTYKHEKADEPTITLLVGKYKVVVNVGRSDSKARLWLSRIYFASNMDRQRMLQNGVLMSFSTIDVLTGNDFRIGFEQKEHRYSSGEYVSKILEVAKSQWTVDGDEIEQDDKASESEMSFEERDMIDVLRCFIDSEYALDQLAAQQCQPFNACSISSRSQRTSYRLHYEVRLDEHDYERLKELQPSLLVVLSEMNEPTDILLEISDISPIENEPFIHVSIEKQAADINIPKSALLSIAALPTLKKVRNAVVDSLENQESKNPWLLSLAAKTYQHQSLRPVTVPIPPSKFPPTPSQVKAINSGAGSDDYTLVLGPPGTGKTTVILQWVKYFAQQGKRVLVTSQNNKAVDNVLERLAEEDDFECLRIGNENKISSSLEAITLDNKAAELQAKMFGNGEDLLKKLGSQKRQLEKLIENKSILSGLISQKTALLQDNELGKNSLKSSRDQLEEVNYDVISQDNSIRKLNFQLNELKNKEWRFLKFVSRWLNSAKTAVLNKRISHAENKIKILQDNRISLESTILDLQQNLVEIPKKITLIQNDIDQFFPHSESVIEEIVLPKGENVQLEDFLSLSDNLSKISELLEHLTVWYDKLKNERQQALYKILIENVNVVGATCIGINTKALFRELDFDVVIVDESGQIQLHNLIVPLSRADKAILVGDHKQLPPVVSDEVIEEIKANDFEDFTDLYRLSWFEDLWNNAPEDRKIMLDTQFRCPSIISDFVSEAFYEGKYFAGVGMDKKMPLLSYCPQPMIWIDTAKVENKFEKANQQDGRTVVQDNPLETQLVINLLIKSIQEKPELAENREIGIIVPYANHVKAIQKAIRREQGKGRLTELKMPLNELVASVDSFQGQERDLIIFTFTRSNIKGQVGFLSDWRRLNVAQTRAKKQLVMIGDSHTLTKGAHKETGHDIEFKKAMKLLKDQCYQKRALVQASKFIDSVSNVRKDHKTVAKNKKVEFING